MARKATYDQTKVTELRMEVIQRSLDVLQDRDDASKWSQYKRDLVLKYAPRVLPVLQEITGRDGDKLKIQITSESAKRYGITSS